MPNSTIELKATGQKMPLVGFGLWKIPKPICADTVYNAIKAGYRLLDGAGDYGNEKEAGAGVAKAISEGLVKREDLFITSKLWNTFHKYENVEPMAKHQLGLWGLEYFDLFLIHFPISLKYVDPAHRFPPEWYGDDGKVEFEDTPLQETWKAMEELVDKKLTKNIGLSNCQGSILLDVTRYARIQPSVLQVELHPYLTQPALVDLCKYLGIAITAYSSFGPQSWVEINLDQGMKSLFKQDAVVEVATAHSKTPAQILLRWATQRGIAVVPKSIDAGRLAQNLDCNSFDLTKEQAANLDGLNINLRLNNPVGMHPKLAVFA